MKQDGSILYKLNRPFCSKQIVLDRFSHLGFVFFEDVNVDIRGDFSIAMTEMLGYNKKLHRSGAFCILKYFQKEIISSRTGLRDELP